MLEIGGKEHNPYIKLLKEVRSAISDFDVSSSRFSRKILLASWIMVVASVLMLMGVIVQIVILLD